MGIHINFVARVCSLLRIIMKNFVLIVSELSIVNDG